MAFVFRIAPENILLNVGLKFHEEANRKKDHACDISAGAKVWLIEARDLWRVEDRDWERHNPDPCRLKDPESEERQEFVSLIIEPIIFARFQNAEQEKSRQTSSPYHDEQRANDLARMMLAGEGESDDSEDDEVGSTREICPHPSEERVGLAGAMRLTGHFIEFECKRNGEEEELIADSDQECDSEVVVVENMDCRHGAVSDAVDILLGRRAWPDQLIAAFGH